jgi:hypothetical protein
MTTEVKTLLSAQSGHSANDPTFFNYGPQVTGAGYNKNNNCLHTVVLDLSTSWIGHIKIQATLELYPGDNDWFDTDISGDGSLVWGDFTTTNAAGLSTANIVGKFVWLRAAYNTQAGVINEIRYNY